MTVDLRIENASDDFIKAIKAMAKIANVNVKVRKEKKLTVNGFTPEFEKELLEDEKDFEKDLKKGKINTYKTAYKAFKAEGLI